MSVRLHEGDGQIKGLMRSRGYDPLIMNHYNYNPEDHDARRWGGERVILWNTDHADYGSDGTLHGRFSTSFCQVQYDQDHLIQFFNLKQGNMWQNTIQNPIKLIFDFDSCWFQRVKHVHGLVIVRRGPEGMSIWIGWGTDQFFGTFSFPCPLLILIVNR